MSDQHTQGPPANTLEPRIVEAPRSIVDPELGANVSDLGLIDGLEVGEVGDIRIRMTHASLNVGRDGPNDDMTEKEDSI
jgi:metal-sulfur cluster biosynthetic enzyme